MRLELTSASSRRHPHPRLDLTALDHFCIGFIHLCVFKSALSCFLSFSSGRWALAGWLRMTPARMRSAESGCSCHGERTLELVEIGGRFLARVGRARA